MTPDLISKLFNSLKSLESIIEKYKFNKTTFALSFINNLSGISAIIPRIHNPEQIEQNLCSLIKIEQKDLHFIYIVFENNFKAIIEKMG